MCTWCNLLISDIKVGVFQQVQFYAKMDENQLVVTCFSPKHGWQLPPDGRYGDTMIVSKGGYLCAHIDQGGHKCTDRKSVYPPLCDFSFCSRHCIQQGLYCQRHSSEWHMEQSAKSRGERANRRRGGKRARHETALEAQDWDFSTWSRWLWCLIVMPKNRSTVMYRIACVMMAPSNWLHTVMYFAHLCFYTTISLCRHCLIWLFAASVTEE